jgi:hypothetical protein
MSALHEVTYRQFVRGDWVFLHCGYSGGYRDLGLLCFWEGDIELDGKMICCDICVGGY